MGLLNMGWIKNTVQLGQLLVSAIGSALLGLQQVGIANLKSLNHYGWNYVKYS
jgi:hypothetical protein